MMSNRKILSIEKPELLKEWDFEKNKSICLPDEVTVGSDRKVWWICSKCGNEWMAAISHRTSNNKPTGCPKCGLKQRANKRRIPRIGINDLESQKPEIAKQWNYEKNGSLKPTDVTVQSGTKVWWICERGHEWEATVSNRVNGRGCPYCSSVSRTSLAEQSIFFYLSKVFNVANRYKVSNNEIDIFLNDYNIGIEYDGIYFHSKPNKKDKEIRKNKELLDAGVDLIRIKQDRGTNEIDGNIIYYVDNNYKGIDDMLRMLISLLEKKVNKKIDIDINFERDRIKILNNYERAFYSNSVENKYPRLVNEWNWDKNGNLSPKMFSVESVEKVWWKCEKGHEWKASIRGRVKGLNCPYCGNQKVLTGYNDLQTQHPELVKEWDWEKNENISPSEVLGGSRKKYWWKCKKCGHEWMASIDNRTRGTGCPKCGKIKAATSKSTPIKGVNDLETLFPLLAKEWNWDKNNISPSEVNVGSPKKVWWKCDKGHEWEAQIRERTKGAGCPYCKNRKVLRGFNDLATTCPELLNLWDWEKNENISPYEITKNSNKKVWWKCKKCGHEWITSPNKRIRYNPSKCPSCKQ